MGKKRGSYKFEKRQKELKKQKKKREKLERRQNKGAGFEEEPQPTGWPIDPAIEADEPPQGSDESDRDEE